MTTCDELRAALIEAKAKRNRAMVEIAMAENAGTPVPHTSADLAALRLAVDIAALELRNAGCEVGDLAGPDVGAL